jgi:hypothetical protein
MSVELKSLREPCISSAQCEKGRRLIARYHRHGHEDQSRCSIFADRMVHPDVVVRLLQAEVFV